MSMMMKEIKCANTIFLCDHQDRVSVRKVVLTLTSKSAEIYLSMAGAKQLVTRGLSWFRPEPYVQQWYARDTILRCTVVLAEGSYKRDGRGGRASACRGELQARRERRQGLQIPEV
jgi:hypothetical protein